MDGLWKECSSEGRKEGKIEGREGRKAGREGIKKGKIEREGR